MDCLCHILHICPAKKYNQEAISFSCLSEWYLNTIFPPCLAGREKEVIRSLWLHLGLHFLSFFFHTAILVQGHYVSIISHVEYQLTDEQRQGLTIRFSV